MQLSHPAVGYGVVESRVESGQIFRHPIKRTRTTLTYLVVAARGTDEEKEAFRNGVNRVHAKVQSGPDSPVQYDAFDPELQLWVAACIYRGFEDVHRSMHGELTATESEYFYQQGATFGTTLQVPKEMWPDTRAAFEEYWNKALADVSIDDTIREYLSPSPRSNSCPPSCPDSSAGSTCSSPPASCHHSSATRCTSPGPPRISDASTGP